MHHIYYVLLFKKEPKKYLIKVVYIYSFKYFTFNINNLKVVGYSNRLKLLQRLIFMRSVS